MPYEFSFTEQVNVADRARYINDCCVGGDIVSAALLPALQARCGQIDDGQEDWGWYLWANEDGLRLAVHVFTDDSLAGRFRARVATSKRRRFFGYREVDTAALEELKDLVHARLTSWIGLPPLVVHDD